MNNDQNAALAEAPVSDQDARNAANALRKWARVLSDAKTVALVLDQYASLVNAQGEIELTIATRRAELAQLEEDVEQGKTAALEASVAAEGAAATRLAAVEEQLAETQHRLDTLNEKAGEALQRLAAAEERERELQSKRSELLRSLEGA